MIVEILKRYLILMLLLSFSPSLFATQIKIVETEPVSLGEIRESIQLIGTIRARHSTLLAAKANGFLDYEVEPGRHLKKGDLIAKLENSNLAKNYAIAQEAEALQQKQTDRLKKLIKRHASSANALEMQYHSTLEAKKNLTQAKIALDQTQLLAPFDGIVGAYKAHEGAQVQAGTPVVYFYDPSKLLVEFNIPAPVLPKVGFGTEVFVAKRAYRLSHVQKMLDPDTHMAPAVVPLVCDSCTIGASVKLELVLNNKKNTIVIPYEAVFLREGKHSVYGVKEGAVQLLPVELGIRDKQKVEILVGLSQGTSIIVTGHQRLYPGLQVTVHNLKELPKQV